MIRVGVGFSTISIFQPSASAKARMRCALRVSQSACSQHLARMRDEGLVGFRRESQTLWYSIADARVETLLATLYQLYCKD